MKRITLILLVFSIFVMSGGWASAQWLPVYSSNNTAHPEYADTLDGRYAVMYYDTTSWGARSTGRITYEIGQTVKVSDHYKVRIYARIPQGVDFHLSMRTDSSNWSILHSTVPIVGDNQTAVPKDTVLTFEVPAYSKFHYARPFHQLTLIRDYLNKPRASKEDILIDGISFELIEDTIITPHDDTVVVTPPDDTILSGVKVNYGMPKITFDNIPPVDLLGRTVTDTTKSGVYFIRGRKKIVAE
jgi:hypothetical protein